MKPSLTILATLALCACASDDLERLPVGPTPTTGAWLWGMVVDVNGVCIHGAKVEVVRGQSAGQTLEQDPLCDVWAYSGGFTFRNLRSGVPMTIRASAPGYGDIDQVVVPHLGPQTAFIFEPPKVASSSQP